MKRTLGFMFFLAMVTLGGACASEKTANDNSGTNANVQNLNANNAPANVGVVTNNNGNKNTAGVRPINGNANSNRP
jgi:hypothetical protein